MKEKSWFKDQREINLYAQIPEDLIYDKNKEMPIHAVRVYGVLDRHLNKKNGECFPGHRRISDKTGISRSQIQKSLDYLEEKGFIRILRVDGKSNSYELMPVGNLVVGGVAPQEGRSKKVAPPSVQSGPTPGQPPAPPSVHNESSLTKDKKTTPQGDFVDFFKSQYLKKFGKPYVESRADYVKASELLKLFQPESLRAMVPGAWDHKDAFIQKISVTVKGFCSVVNSLSLPGTSKESKITPGAPVDMGQLALQRKWKEDQKRDDELKRLKNASQG